MATIRETDLFEPVKHYLEAQGYSVHAEVKHVDVIARHIQRPDEIIAVELKTRMSLDLVIQAARRKEITDSVYIAVPVFGSRGHLRNASGILALLRRIETGLLLVRFLRKTIRVEPILHPQTFSPRTRERRKLAILREVDSRYAEFDPGGLATHGASCGSGEPADPGRRRLTAFRQQSLLIAELLRRNGPASPKTLRALGAPSRCGAIMSRNIYGWFDRISRGVYQVHPAGVDALEANSPEVEQIVATVL